MSQNAIKSNDTLLCELHEQYIAEATESGMPLYLIHNSIPSYNPEEKPEDGRHD